MNMNDEEFGKTNHIDVEANNNSEQGKKLLVRLLGEKPLVPLRRVLLLSLILASVSLDPLFFYISVINNDSNCLQSDNVLRIIAVILRTFADGAYLTLRWRRMKNSTFLIVAALAFLPLPQVLVYAGSWRLHTVKLLKLVVLIQFVPRVYLTFPTYKYAIKCFRGIMKLTFAATFYFLMFTVAGNVLGAFWYLRAIERNMDCWKKACKTRGLCGVSSLYCHGSSINNKYLDEFCPIPPAPDSTFFDYGIYLDAFQRNLMGMHTNIINKVFYCTWWGLLSLSSFGQNLDPGTYVWDNIFSTFIVVSGLILFALLIGNMQLYLQKASADADERERVAQEEKEKRERMAQDEKEKQDRMVREEKEKQERMAREEKEKQERMARMEKGKQERMARMERALDIWRPFHSLPLLLKAAIASCEDEKWLGTTNINLLSLLKNSPSSIGRDIKLHFCKDLFSKVENFEKLDTSMKIELRERAKPVVFQARRTIHREGYPIHEMIHIVNGKALVFKKDSNRNEGLRLHEDILVKNDPIGKELLDKSLESPKPSLLLATETVMALTTVEAFTLSFDDFASVFTCHGQLIPGFEEEWAVWTITAAFRRKHSLTNRKRYTTQ